MSACLNESGSHEMQLLETALSELCSQCFCPDAIYRAAAAGCADDLRDILLLCDDVTRRKMLDWSDDYKRTALIMATQEGHGDCVDLLLAEGANVHHVCDHHPDGTALHVAVFYRQSRTMISQLIRHGADPFVENSRGMTPWDMSLMQGHACSIEFASCGMFEGLVYVKNSKVQPSVRSTGAYWVRVVPRYNRPDTFDERHLIGIRMYIHWRLLGDTICEIDLDGCKAEIISDNEDDAYNLLLACPSNRILTYEDHLGGHIGGGLVYLWLGGEMDVLDALVGILNSTEEGLCHSATDDDDVDEELDDDFNSDSSSEILDCDISTAESSNMSQAIKSTKCDHSQLSSRQLSRALGPRGIAGKIPLMTHTQKPAKLPGLVPEKRLPARNSEESIGSFDQSTACVICLDRPKTVGFVHGKSIHICSCETCAEMVSQSSNRCPLCRKAIQHIVTEIY